MVLSRWCTIRLRDRGILRMWKPRAGDDSENERGVDRRFVPDIGEL